MNYLSGSFLRRRLLSGSTWASGGRIGGAMLGIVTNGLLARLLSPQELGAYFLALSIVSLGAVVGSMGLPKTVVRLVAENMGLDRSGRTLRAIRTVLGLGVLGTLGISLAYLLAGDLVGELFQPQYSSLLVGVTGLMAGWIAIAVVQEITAETFRGFHDIRLATLLGGLATGGKSGGVIMRVLLLGILALLWVRSAETSLATVLLVSIGSGSVSVLLSIWLLYAKVSSLGSSQETQQQEEEPVSAKEVLEDAIPFLAIALTSFMLLSADIWILGALGSGTDVAVYGAASKLVTFVAMPLLIVNLVLPPIVAEMYAQGKMSQLERTLRTFSTLAGIPSLLVLAVFMLLGGPILGLVYSKPIYYSGTAVLVLVILSAAKLIAVWSGSCGLVLQFTGHQTSMLRVSLLTSPLFFVVAILATQRYGSVGVACAAGLTTTLQNVIMVMLAKRKTGMWTHVMFSLSPFRKVLSRRAVTEKAPVPDLVGADSIEKAREKVGDQFEILEDKRVQSRVATGTIVAQNPQAGETAQRGSAISVDVSATQIADLPNVEGKTREEAEQILQEAGFEVEVKIEESSVENKNLVTGAAPQSGKGATAEVGSTVTITVGDGPASVEVPLPKGRL
jgi:O-antigen/teichoic acid export membrane protein